MAPFVCLLAASLLAASQLFCIGIDSGLMGGWWAGAGKGVPSSGQQAFWRFFGRVGCWSAGALGARCCDTGFQSHGAVWAGVSRCWGAGGSDRSMLEALRSAPWAEC